MNVEEYSGILVYLEDEKGVLSKSSLGVLGKARYLAETLGVNIAGAIFTEAIEVLTKEAIAYGTDKVYAKEIKSFSIKDVLNALYSLIIEKKPEIVLFSNSEGSKNLAPRLAQRLGIGLGCNCTALEIDFEKRTLLMTFPIYEGKMLKEVASTIKRPQVAMISEVALVEPMRDDLREGEITKI